METKITFPFQARYFTLGNTSNPHQIWFVLHGYGQLAENFIRRFKVLEHQNILVIAPEGLSKFYLHDTSSRVRSGDTRVGASWMTREDRLTDIHNYLTYLGEVYREVMSKHERTQVTILGFSQGAATATRWALSNNTRFSKLVLWAGIFPPDVDFSKGKEILMDKEVFLVYGKSDPFLSDERFAEMNLLSQKLGITPKQVAYDGEHRIDEQTLLQLI